MLIEIGIHSGLVIQSCYLSPIETDIMKYTKLFLKIPWLDWIGV